MGLFVVLQRVHPWCRRSESTQSGPNHHLIHPILAIHAPCLPSPFPLELPPTNDHLCHDQLDSTYTQVRQISSVGPIQGDLHEFRFTRNGTALLTVYEITPADLSPIGGPSNGWVWDGAIQEIDLATGNLLFTWKSTDHYHMNDTYHKYGGGGDSPSNPFDYFHINSIDKDDRGNYLISARYTHSVTYIDGRTGSVLWQLGGKRNSFADLTDGRATNFAWQHDARWHNNNSAITLFDNGAEAGLYTSEHSRGMRIAINESDMTARLTTEYVNPAHPIISSSQGSTQVLANGNVLVGYGYNGAFTEFSANGAVLCDTHFGPEARFESGDVQSYRVQKARWVGRPNTKPDVRVEGSSVYASWNGATEVHRWVLQDADYAQMDGAESGEVGFEDEVGEAWWPVQTVEKAGFETELRFGVTVRRYVRVVALDREGRVLGASEPGGTRLDEELRNSVSAFWLSWTALDGDGLLTCALFSDYHPWTQGQGWRCVDHAAACLRGHGGHWRDSRHGVAVEVGSNCLPEDPGRGEGGRGRGGRGGREVVE